MDILQAWVVKIRIRIEGVLCVEVTHKVQTQIGTMNKIRRKRKKQNIGMQ
jgi:predicted metalloprotease